MNRFQESPNGTLYLTLNQKGGPELMVRRFDSEVPPRLAPVYAELIRSTQKWLERRPPLAKLVRVELPLEVGADFIARKFHVYHASTRAYTSWEDPPEIPAELDQMRQEFRAARNRSLNAKDAIVERVLARNVLEPTGKTYFGEPADDPSGDQFIIVEPKITLADLEEWQALDLH